MCWCKPTTVVSFSPVGNTPGIAPGFAYAFRAPAPLYTPTSVYTGASPILSGPLSNHITDTAQGPTILKTQYHSQDELGQYAFGYVGGSSTAHEVRTLDGAVRGSYTYLDSNGELQTANYIADNNGFRVEATNLPLAPVVPDVPPMILPVPVKLTPEVAAATAAHLKAVAEIKAARSKRSAPSKGYLPPSPTSATKESKYTLVPTKVELVAEQVPSKEEHKVSVPVKKVVAEPVSLEVSHLPVPLGVASPVVLSHLHSPINVLPGPFHAAGIPQAIFVRADPIELQSLSPISGPIPTVVPVRTPILASVPAAPIGVGQSHVLSQFHAQDELGGYEYGYEGGPSSKHEVHTPDGVTRGSYSYIDANGELQTVSYTADDVFGFRVIATNLPVAPADSY